MYVEETILEYLPKKTLIKLYNFGKPYPNVVFFVELEPLFTCPQEDMKI